MVFKEGEKGADFKADLVDLLNFIVKLYILRFKEATRVPTLFKKQ